MSFTKLLRAMPISFSSLSSSSVISSLAPSDSSSSSPASATSTISPFSLSSDIADSDLTSSSSSLDLDIDVSDEIDSSHSQPSLSNLFDDWFGLDETQEFVRLAIQAQSSPISPASSSVFTTPSSADCVSLEIEPIHSSSFSSSSYSSPSFDTSSFSAPSESSMLAHFNRRFLDHSATKPVKQFYFPNGVPASPGTSTRHMALIKKIFNPYPLGVTEPHFMSITSSLCGLSIYMNALLFKRIDTAKTGRVTLEAFLDYWRRNLQDLSVTQRLFRILKQPDQAYVTRSDLEPLLLEIVQSHPGLSFLKTTEFQFRYVETVIARIFYRMNRKRDDKLTLGEMRRGKFADHLAKLEKEEDINKFTEFFSYEHFYVIYLKFWQLDTDHDFIISSQDLARYDNGALNARIIDRIFSGAAGKLTGGGPDRMGYKDFVTFLMSEVDKTSNTALEYWFRCVDSDNDGIISIFEMQPFLEQQRAKVMQRQRLQSSDAPLLTDMLCQLNDMIKPAREGHFTLRDIKRSRHGPAFFDSLFNVVKYISLDHKDPYAVQRLRLTPTLTDWDRFAHSEYQRLAASVLSGSHAVHSTASGQTADMGFSATVASSEEDNETCVGELCPDDDDEHEEDADAEVEDAVAMADDVEMRDSKPLSDMDKENSFSHVAGSSEMGRHSPTYRPEDEDDDFVLSLHNSSDDALEEKCAESSPESSSSRLSRSNRRENDENAFQGNRSVSTSIFARLRNFRKKNRTNDGQSNSSMFSFTTDNKAVGDETRKRSNAMVGGGKAFDKSPGSPTDSPPSPLSHHRQLSAESATSSTSSTDSESSDHYTETSSVMRGPAAPSPLLSKLAGMINDKSSGTSHSAFSSFAV